MVDYLLATDPLWYAPFAGMDSGLWIDPLTAVSGAGEASEVEVAPHYGSGATAAASLSCPAPGAVRLTIGEPDLAVPGAGGPVAVIEQGGEVLITGPGVQAALGPGGLRTAALPRPGDRPRSCRPSGR